MNHSSMSREQRARLLKAAVEGGVKIQGVSTLDGELVSDLSIAMTEVVEDYPQLVERYERAINLLQRSSLHNPTTPYSTAAGRNFNADVSKFLTQEQ